MLRVTVHAGRLADISAANRLDWLDIGYEKLDAFADYKVVLFNIGVGATPPAMLWRYPRWSTSLWDLVARGIVTAVNPPRPEPKPGEPVAPEVLYAIEQVPKRFAFAGAISAAIEHHPSSGRVGRRLASMEIVQRGARGCYRATVEEDLWPARSTLAFHFRPKFLRPIDLVLQGALMHLTGSLDAMPPRPPLILPGVPAMVDGKPYVMIHLVREPARTGFLRWLHRSSEPPLAYDGARDGIAPEPMFTKFLQVAV